MSFPFELELGELSVNVVEALLREDSVDLKSEDRFSFLHGRSLVTGSWCTRLLTGSGITKVKPGYGGLTTSCSLLNKSIDTLIQVYIHNRV